MWLRILYMNKSWHFEISISIEIDFVFSSCYQVVFKFFHHDKIEVIFRVKLLK